MPARSHCVAVTPKAEGRQVARTQTNEKHLMGQSMHIGEKKLKWRGYRFMGKRPSVAGVQLHGKKTLCGKKTLRGKRMCLMCMHRNRIDVSEPAWWLM